MQCLHRFNVYTNLPTVLVTVVIVDNRKKTRFSVRILNTLLRTLHTLICSRSKTNTYVYPEFAGWQYIYTILTYSELHYPPRFQASYCFVCTEANPGSVYTIPNGYLYSWKGSFHEWRFSMQIVENGGVSDWCAGSVRTKIFITKPYYISRNAY